MSSGVTQKQIAARLGISPGMVGRALRNDPAYSPATIERIQSMAREMGYHEGLNHNARQLARRRHGHEARHGIIGLVSPEILECDLPYHSHLRLGCMRAAQEHGYELLGINPQPSPGWSKVDGILGFGERDAEVASHLVDGMPFVSLGSQVPDHCSVLADEADGIEQTVQYLVGLGHQRIGYLADPISILVRRRQQAYQSALAAAGISALPEWQHLLYNWGAMEVRGRISMQTWLDQGFAATGITALLVQNDRSAIGAMETLQNSGYAVPGNVSVVGFDGTDECELSTPHLTSVSVPLQDLGARAVELLLSQILEQEQPSRSVVLPVSLTVRASTGAPGER